MKTYLVTGGCGFIGSNYIRYMMETYGDDIFIVNVDALTYAGNLSNLQDIEQRKNYKFVRADICEQKIINRIFQEYTIDRVVHFAAESHVDKSIEDPEKFVRTNVLGTYVLLNAAKNAWETADGKYLSGRRMLHVSTDEVYGSLEEDGTFFSEETPYAPHSPYAASKAGADMLVKSYIDTYHFPANITNCSNNYGPYQFPEKLIPFVIDSALKGKRIPIYGDGKNIRDWLYVEDHVQALDLVLEKGKLYESYNIGGHQEKRNIEVVHKILEIMKEMIIDLPKENIVYVEDRKGHDRRYAIAPDKLIRDTGWHPKTSFEDGIRKTVQWYLKNRKWLEDISEGNYSGGRNR